MVCRVEVVAEVADWLDGVRRRDPLAARLVDDSVSALAAQGSALGLPLVVRLESAWNLPEALDMWYQDRFERLLDVRAALADAEQTGSTQQLQEMRARHDRMQTDTDTFRVWKESLKQGYLAAEAAGRVAGVAELFGEPIPGYDRPMEWSTFKMLRPTRIANDEVRIVFVMEEPGDRAVLLYGAASEQEEQSWYSDVVPEALRRYRRHTEERVDLM